MSIYDYRITHYLQKITCKYLGFFHNIQSSEDSLWIKMFCYWPLFLQNELSTEDRKGVFFFKIYSAIPTKWSLCWKFTAGKSSHPGPFILRAFVTCYHKMGVKLPVSIQRYYSLLNMPQNNRKQRKIKTKYIFLLDKTRSYTHISYIILKLV